MKHYIWLSVLLAVGVVGADDAAVAKEEVAAAPEADKAEEAAAPEAPAAEADKAEEAPAAEEVPTEDVAANSVEENKSDEDSPKKSKKSKKSKRKGSKSRRKGHKGHKGHKGRKGGHKVSAPSSSVLNAYMNRVQSGEMCGTAPEASMSATVSGQGGCATGNCGLPAPEAIDAPAPDAIAAA